MNKFPMKLSLGKIGNVRVKASGSIAGKKRAHKRRSATSGTAIVIPPDKNTATYLDKAKFVRVLFIRIFFAYPFLISVKYVSPKGSAASIGIITKYMLF